MAVTCSCIIHQYLMVLLVPLALQQQQGSAIKSKPVWWCHGLTRASQKLRRFFMGDCFFSFSLVCLEVGKCNRFTVKLLEVTSDTGIMTCQKLYPGTYLKRYIQARISWGNLIGNPFLISVRTDFQASHYASVNDKFKGLPWERVSLSYC